MGRNATRSAYAGVFTDYRRERRTAFEAAGSFGSGRRKLRAGRTHPPKLGLHAPVIAHRRRHVNENPSRIRDAEFAMLPACAGTWTANSPIFLERNGEAARTHNSRNRLAFRTRPSTGSNWASTTSP